MGAKTNIQWCDSTNNAQMGCEGCELIKGQDKPKCYAGNLTKRYQGLTGWPQSFDKPKIFMHRVPKMINWPDLTSTTRNDKPWLNNMPRLIFLNDMGDTFTKGLPVNWFADVLQLIKDSPHQYLVLSKWPKRFAAFSKQFTLPHNVWCGTSVTSQKTLFRVNEIKQVHTTSIKWLSVEPLWGFIDFGNTLDGIDWVIIGGESGTNPVPCEIENIMHIIKQCQDKGVAVFVKQTGTWFAKQNHYKDGHGGDWNEWPEALKVRQMPLIKSTK